MTVSAVNGPARIPRTGRFLALALAVLAAIPAQAQAPQQRRSTTLIRDAEIEQLMRDYLNPLLNVAGLRAGTVQVVLVGSRDFNAFVADRRRVFINVGTIMESPTPNQVIGVLAHETGHIAGGHLARLRQELERAQTLAILGSLLGAVAVVGAARGGSNVGIGGAATGGLLSGGTELAQRSFLQYQRSEEQAADRAAVTYLTQTRQSARGMIETFERFAQQSLFTGSRVDRYLLSHPLPQERIASLQELARSTPFYAQKDPPALQARHDLVRAKLFAFIGGPDEVARRYPLSDRSLAARYARAISAYRFGRLDAALGQIDDLIREQPRNAYFHELRGQALLEAGRAREAVGPLRRAAALAPGQPLIRMLLGHALVASDEPANVNQAVAELSKALQSDPEAADGYRYLAMAYEKRGDTANAELAAATGFMIEGQVPEAQRIARRAQSRFKEGSPGWLRADDIVNARPPNRR